MCPFQKDVLSLLERGGEEGEPAEGERAAGALRDPLHQSSTEDQRIGTMDEVHGENEERETESLSVPLSMEVSHDTLT